RCICFFFFQAEDGIRGFHVTGVQTCALPIYVGRPARRDRPGRGGAPVTDRAALIRSFLDTAGWGGARRSTLAGDASFRRYDRLVGGPRPAVLMDAAPPKEDVRPFVAVARRLKALGFSAPEIYAEDIEHGLLLL